MWKLMLKYVFMFTYDESIITILNKLLSYFLFNF